MTDKSRIIEKIKKCLALSQSSNEHEAQAALRQAQKLMEAHSVTAIDIKAANASENRAKAGAAMKPTKWETMLVRKVADAFGCEIIFSQGYALFAKSGEWIFIGCGASPEVASYSFSVLSRQLKRARQEHIKTRLKRCKKTNKTRRADLFCEGWVVSVTSKINALANNEEQAEAINAYLNKNVRATSEMKSRDRSKGKRLKDNEMDDYFSGSRSGKAAQLHHGVNGTEQAKLTGELG